MLEVYRSGYSRYSDRMTGVSALPLFRMLATYLWDMVDFAHRMVGNLNPFWSNAVRGLHLPHAVGALNILSSTRGSVVERGALILDVTTYDALLHQLDTLLEKQLADSGFPPWGYLHPHLASRVFLPCRLMSKRPVMKAFMPSNPA